MKTAARRTLSALGWPRSELSVTFCGDPFIRRLNRRYLGRDRSTDVIAFPIDVLRRSDGGAGLAGEVVISLDTAARQAREQGHSLTRETAILLIHGILHLAGYDDHRPADRRRMERRTEQILATLGPRR